jgi:hypothetical protein
MRLLHSGPNVPSCAGVSDRDRWQRAFGLKIGVPGMWRDVAVEGTASSLWRCILALREGQVKTGFRFDLRGPAEPAPAGARRRRKKPVATEVLPAADAIGRGIF